MNQSDDLVKGLRELAEFLEQNPEFPCPYIGAINIYVDCKEDLIDLAKVLGTAEKGVVGDWFYLTRKFPGKISLEVNIARTKVCER